MSGRMRLLTRGAVTSPLLSLLVIIVIAVLSALAVAAPALLSDGRTATIRRGVASVPDLTRWPSATMPGLPLASRTSDDSLGAWGGALAAVEQLRRTQPEPLRSLLGTPRITVGLDPSSTVDDDPQRTDPVPLNRVGLVSDPGLAGRVDLAEGRMPKKTDPADGVEIVFTRKVADELKWRVGEQRRWDRLQLTLVGIVTPNGKDAGDWTFIGGSSTPRVEVDGGGNRILIGAAFMHVDEASLLDEWTRNAKINSWMPFRTAGVDVTTAERASAQLRLLSADVVAIRMPDNGFYSRGLQFHSTLPQALDAGISRANAMTPVVTVAAVGPMMVALVVLTLVARLIAVRRVAGIRVLRARGASLGRLIALLGGEGALLGAIGAAIGVGGAAATSGLDGGRVLAVPVILALVPAVALPWSTLADAAAEGRRDLGERQGRETGRIALELLALAATVALAILVIARGQGGGADPVLLALTVLLGVVGSILTLRLLPLLLRLAERRGARRESLESLLGPARARRESAVRNAPVFGVVAGLGVAVFSIAFAATVSGGIVRAADIDVGADVRVDAAYITDAAVKDVAALDGVAALAATQDGDNAQISAGTNEQQTRVYVLDRAAFTRVQQGFDTRIPLPASLGERADGPVPVVMSRALWNELGGAEAKLEIGRTPVRVVGVVASDVPFGSTDEWVIVDAAGAKAVGQDSTGYSQLYLATASGADPDAVGAAAVAAAGGNAVFTTPERVVAAHAEDPGYTVVRGALLAASGIVAVLLIVAIIATLALGADTRARMLAILRTLGSVRRTAGRLVTWEVAPALLLALPFGVGAGVATAMLVIPQLDLRGFVGGSAQPPVSLGGVWTLAAVVGFALVAAFSVAVAAGLASRLDSADAIRAGDERMP